MHILKTMTDPTVLDQLLATRAVPGQATSIDPVVLEGQLNNRIFGQQDAVRSLVGQITRRFAKVKRSRPVGVFLIAGPSGTGKSEMGKAVGEALYSSGGYYLVEMGKLSNAMSVTSLFGAPAGYVGHDRKAGLMAHLESTPKTVVILDEFEKAAEEVQFGFLSGWNDGAIRNMTDHKLISTRDAIFVLTSNAMEEEIALLAARGDLNADELSDRCKEVLKNAFPSSILSRIDYVFAFAPLSPRALAAIALDMIRQEVEEYGMTCGPIPPHVLLPYVDRYHGAKFDAREIRRHIERDFGSAVNTLKQNGVKAIEVVYDTKKETMTIKAAKGG